MMAIASLIAHVAPDSIRQLESAARRRYWDACFLKQHAERKLTALYLFGYSVEMCLAAAYYRSTGYPVHAPIDRDMRRRRMTQARQMQTPAGEPLMSGDPHPLVGWARLLHNQRGLTALTSQEERRLNEAIHQAEAVYRHWRPELRYKTVHVTDSQLRTVYAATSWFVDTLGRL